MKQGKQFKRLWGLMLLLIAMLMPQGAWAENFISEIKIGANSNQNTAKGYLSGYELINRDLNYGNGSNSWYIYLGYKTDTDASNAITGIMIVSGDYLGDEYLEGGTKTLSYDGKTWYRSPAQGAADLNKGAGGDDLTIFYTRDGNTVNGGKPLVSLSVEEDRGLSGYTYAGLYKNGAFSANGNTNQGAKGAARYITYTTHTHAFANADYDTSNHKYWCASCGYVSSTSAHDWKNTGAKISDVTCETAEVYYQKCSVCGRTNDANHTYTTALALGHNYNANGVCTHDASHFQEPTLSSGYYQIANYGNLCWFRDKVNGGSYTINAKQTADVTIPDGVTWDGIGHKTNSSNGFKGTYDGNCHTISGLKISQLNTAFFNTTNKATIKNLGLLNVSVSSSQTAGLVRMADNSTTINNCYVTGSAARPLCYTNTGNSTITNCFANVTNGLYIVASNYATITNCYTNLSQINNSGSGTASNCRTGVNAATFASGEIAYLLNSGKTDGTQVWYQKLGTDALPTLVKNTSNTVYKRENLKCDGVTKNGSVSYGNSSTAPVDGHGLAGYTPTYTWGGNYADATCSFTLKCNQCDRVMMNQNFTPTKVPGNHVDATCVKDGNETWTVPAVSYSKTGDVTYNGAAQTEDYAITALNHDYTHHLCSRCDNAEAGSIYDGTQGDYKWRIYSDGDMIVYREGNGGHSLGDWGTDFPSWYVRKNYIKYVGFFDKDGIEAPTLRNAFNGCTNLTSIDFGDLHTDNTKDMKQMFENCYGFTSLDLSNFNTANVTDMNSMFSECWNLATLDLSSFNTAKVTDMNSMFSNCWNLATLDLSSFNTAKVTDMKQMFFRCEKLASLDLSNFNTARVTDMTNMFGTCSNLTSLDLSSFTTNSVTSFKAQFTNCQALTSVTFGNLYIRNGADTESMFYKDNNLSIIIKSLPYAGGTGFKRNIHDGVKVRYELDDNSKIYPCNQDYLPAASAPSTYTRTGIKNQWGTIVVPFAVNGSGDDYDLYTLSGGSEDELTLTKVNGTLAAGTPALIRLHDELAGNYDLTLTAANTAVSDQLAEGSEADGYQLVGTYETTELSADDYFISNNKFWSVGDMLNHGASGVMAAPFRAYLRSTIAGAKASSLSIRIENDNTTTAVETLNAITEGDAEYYDLNGRKLNSLQKGVNIVKMSNGKTIKVNIK